MPTMHGSDCTNVRGQAACIPVFLFRDDIEHLVAPHTVVVLACAYLCFYDVAAMVSRLLNIQLA